MQFVLGATVFCAGALFGAGIVLASVSKSTNITIKKDQGNGVH